MHPELSGEFSIARVRRRQQRRAFEHIVLGVLLLVGLVLGIRQAHEARAHLVPTHVERQ